MKKVLSFLLSLVMIFSIIIIPASGAGEAKKLTVLFTHDLHSHIDTTTQLVNGNKAELGGFARLKTLIDGVRVEGNNTLLVDGGDFSMGTLFQSAYADEAIELRMMGLLGYDATTFGNHEFDYDSGNVAKMLNNAKAKGTNLPKLLTSNINWDKSTSPDKEALKAALANYGAVEDYTVVQKGDVKIAMFGLIGSDAAFYTPRSGLTFDDISASAKQTVANIKANEKDVDMIVCLSHSGTDADSTKSEDEILAKNVPEIDVIVSGHTHSTLGAPKTVGNTSIVSCGEYGKNLGRLDMTKNATGRWTVDTYKVTPVDSSVVADPATLAQVESFRELVKPYLAKFGYSEYNQVIAQSPYDFEDVDTIYQLRDHDLTGLITDSYIYAVKQAEGENYAPIDVSLVPAGVIRSTFLKGDITVANVYEVSSLGIGNDGLSGYPLVSIYLSGEELKLIAELDASVSPFMNSIQFFTTGLQYTYNPNRGLLNEATNICLKRPDGSVEQINDKQLYRVVTGIYTAQMFEEVQNKSFNILSVRPKDKDGNIIKDFNNAIIYDSTRREVKEWYALSSYLQSFEKESGVPTIPQKYENAPQNKTFSNSKKLKDIYSNPNKYYKILYCIFGGTMAAVIFALAHLS